ncbi:hypothetical protein MEX01_38280 [Methylorubrum extorquens]|nr:hypothetical protein [Methylorubrum extorquens]GEL43237.1 hypothetical protein MEX01_38280 [Methylorubrum extorquens]
MRIHTKALGESGDESNLKQAVTEIYKADEYASQLAKSLQQAAV